MTLLLTFLVGAATALVVQLVIQLYVVPKVETRKRREDRWERNVLELGELLTSLVGDSAQEARLEQSIFRAMSQEDTSGPEYDQAKVARGMAERAMNTRHVTSAFIDLVRTRVYWLAERVWAPMPNVIETRKFQIAYMWYLTRAEQIAGWSKDEDRTDAAFEESWEKERVARYELITQVKQLADLRNPPRGPWRARLKKPFKNSRTG
jgi:hypothetical protein